MEWILPGTVLVTQREKDGAGRQMLKSLFLGGDITLAQVAAVTGLETHTVQNWVKRGFLTPPIGKKYTIDQLCRIVNINMLRGVFTLERTCALLGYINGQLDNDADDIIGDAQLYFMFVNLAARAQQLTRPEACERIIVEMLRDYQEPYPGAKERVSDVLKVMLTAYLAARMRSSADQMLTAMEAKIKDNQQ